MKSRLIAFTLATGIVAGAAYAGEVVFVDPKADDDGAGGYTYPTDPAFERGSFDLEQVSVVSQDNRVNFAVKLNAQLEDPWRTGAGYSVQMIFIFIDTDNVPASGHIKGVPGLNVMFDRDSAWDKVVVLSPQDQARVKKEIEAKAPDMAADIVTTRSKATGQTISAGVSQSLLGEGDPSKWGYQVVVQSNEGFPAGQDLLTRRVNEFEGSHRFGGGTDFDCDPHVMDILAGNARGDASEVAAQHAMLAYECAEDGDARRTATLRMVRR
jgi:hypothetical protein